MTGYIYPATATLVEEIDETRTLVEEHWTTGDYTLVRRRYDNAEHGFGKSHWTVRAADRDIPEIVDAAPYGSDLPDFGVNWSAMGVRNTSEARKYADRLADAARAADRFTDIASILDCD